MRYSAVATALLTGSALVGACQAIVGIGDRTEAAGVADGGGSDGTSSGSTTSSGGSSSGASSSGGSSSGGSSGTDASDGSKPYDVKALSGLKLWLESTKELAAGSGRLETWSDQSGAWEAGADGAPDGGRHVAEPQDVNPPILVPNGINGRPTLSFVTGSGYARVANHADFRFGLGDFIIVEVAKVSSGNGPLWELRPNTSAGDQEQFLPDQLCVYFGGASGCTAPAVTPPAGPHVFVARRKGDIFTMRLDGTVQSSLDRTSDPVDIYVTEFQKAYAFIGNGVTMQLSEVIIAVGPRSDADLTALENHLKGKYGIP